ncbi:dephospho-CoA kinase [Stieleria sp. TO1_6]|uniref:dephospho-CoA kinase n=1 Tax=Stieleria tagensis TaxID=2956795 RepID=UPI00209A9DE7|nr:dephospho-CoA kinase [Stieleria tagensis]MCO8122975.1 dephospho-CoA kinase [Stieleria tagensis]
MMVLGIVGSPAGGKSTAASFLAEQGAQWINADLIARDCLQHADVISQLTARFGSGLLTEQGTIDRAQVADLVFGTDSAKRENLAFLESLVHPRTRIEIRRQLIAAAQDGFSVALLDVPLLFESGWDRGCDSIWCVHATRARRLQWIQNRGWDSQELDRREANQMPIESKCRLSNVVMLNDATLDALHQNLRRHWEQIARMMDAQTRRATADRSSPTRHCVTDRPMR